MLAETLRNLTRWVSLSLGLAIGCSGSADIESGPATQATSSTLSGCASAKRGATEYLLCDSPSDFSAAKAACAKVGMRLASVDDASENAFLAKQVKEPAFLGLSQTAEAWRWEADGRVTWCGEPATGHAIRPESFANWQPEPGAQCERLRRDGSEYWFCDSETSWTDAEKQCEAVDAKLATVESLVENVFITTHADEDVWLGGKLNPKGDASWVWQATNDVFWPQGGYANWGTKPAEPKNGCLMVGASGMWSAQPCDVKAKFVCERPVKESKERCALLAPSGLWTKADCSQSRGYICEAQTADEQTFEQLTRTSVRDDYRSGARRIGFAEFAGAVTPASVFDRFPEEFGFRPCVDLLSAAGPEVNEGQDSAHQSYQQLYHGLPVLARGYQAKTRAGLLTSVTGAIAPGISLDPEPRVAEAEARAVALASVHLTLPDFPTTPRGQLIVYGDGPNPSWRLAWAFEFPGNESRPTYEVKVGADTPQVLFSASDRRAACSSGDLPDLVVMDETRMRAYQQSPPFNDPAYFGVSRAPDTSPPFYLYSRGASLTPGSVVADTPEMFAHCEGESGSRVGALDSGDITEDPFQPETHQLAAAFLGLQRAVEANAALFRRADGGPWIGSDGYGLLPLRVGLVTTDRADAYWDPAVGQIFVRSPRNLSLFEGASIDLMGHELGHAILDSLALSGRRAGMGPEGRTLDEGFSNVMGEVAEMQWRGATGPGAFCFRGDQGVLNGSGVCVDDFRQPELSDGDECEAALGAVVHRQCPGDYRGPDYCSDLPFADPQVPGTCGPHRNTTILSHWFYLLSVGDSGTYDASCGVEALPLDPNPDQSFRKAATLLFEGMAVLDWSPLVGFEALAETTLSLAIAKWGLGSPEVRSVIDAWFKVNVRQDRYLPTRGGLVPPREARAVYPWSRFSWPVETAGSWDIQVATGRFFDAGALVYQADDIVDYDTVDGSPVVAHYVTLPAESDLRYYWRVRPHSADPWLECWPIHSFVGTRSVDPADVIEVRPEDPSGRVTPGDADVRFSRVAGAKSYKLYLSTFDSACREGTGVEVFEVEADDDDDRLEVESRTGRIEGLQPNEHYFVSVQPIGRADLVGRDPVGPCSSFEFDTGELEAPTIVSPADGRTFRDEDGSERIELQSDNTPEAYIVRLYEIDERGVCSSDVAHRVRFVPLEDPRRVSFGLDISPRNLSGYCFDAAVESTSGRVGPPTDRRRFYYLHEQLVDMAPGAFHAFASSGVGAPLAWNSYGQPVTLSWAPNRNAAGYSYRIGRWPWSRPVPRVPENCTGFLAPLSCEQGSSSGTRSGFTANPSVTLPASSAGHGRYCWTAWPLVAQPGTTIVSVRQPKVEANQVLCYTTGPAEPIIVIEDAASASVFTSGMTLSAPAGFAEGEVRGFARFPYLPEGQFAFDIYSRAGVARYDAVMDPSCTPDPATAPFRDLYDCVVRFRFPLAPNETYSVVARAVNPVDGGVAFSPVVWLRTGPCGARGQYCCADSRCASNAVCNVGRCEACGGTDEPCCDSGCSSRNICVHNGTPGGRDHCRACGRLDELCCEGSRCTEGSCQAGLCRRCGGVGEPCCPGGSCAAGNMCSGGTCRAAPLAACNGADIDAMGSGSLRLPGPAGTILMNYDSDTIPVSVAFSCDGNNFFTTGCCASDPGALLSRRCPNSFGCREDGQCSFRVPYSCPSSVLTVTVNPSCDPDFGTNPDWEAYLACTAG